MANRERSFDRDLTMSNWHRAAFGDDLCKAFDVDLVGICGIYQCRAHLYALEFSREDLERKQSSWTEATAFRLNCTGFLIQYQQAASPTRFVTMRARRCHPPGAAPIWDRQHFEARLAQIRRMHAFVAHDEQIGLHDVLKPETEDWPAVALPGTVLPSEQALP